VQFVRSVFIRGHSAPRTNDLERTGRSLDRPETRTYHRVFCAMDIDLIRARFEEAERVVVLTGAGVSAESGVPTFRGGGGTTVWRGMDATVLSSAEMVEANLTLVWEWFEYRRGILAPCAPNPAHEAIARWQDRFADFTLVTQNIDGLHTKAGSRDVLELHGNIWRGRCTRCGARADVAETPLDEIPPRCPRCGAALRPDVVLFGEYLPAGVFERAVEAAARAEVCFVVGTSAVVYPAAELQAIAARRGALVIEVNPEPCGVFEVSLAGKAGEILPRI
jgi:NAD-dependent deacetylase